MFSGSRLFVASLIVSLCPVWIQHLGPLALPSRVFIIAKVEKLFFTRSESGASDDRLILQARGRMFKPDGIMTYCLCLSVLEYVLAWGLVGRCMLVSVPNLVHVKMKGGGF
jgi:hypothetical protein